MNRPLIADIPKRPLLADSSLLRRVSIRNFWPLMKAGLARIVRPLLPCSGEHFFVSMYVIL